RYPPLSSRRRHIRGLTAFSLAAGRSNNMATRHLLLPPTGKILQTEASRCPTRCNIAATRYLGSLAHAAAHTRHCFPYSSSWPQHCVGRLHTAFRPFGFDSAGLRQIARSRRGPPVPDRETGPVPPAPFHLTGRC